LKLLFHCFLVFCLYAGYCLDRLFLKGVLPKAIGALFILSLTLSGALSVLREPQNAGEFSSKSDQEFAEAARRVIPPEALVLTAGTHNHPITTLAGRKTYIGYEGWLWSWGIEYLPRQAQVAAFYAGGDGRFLEGAGIGYFIIGPPEVAAYRPDVTHFKARYERVFEGDGWYVFKVPADGRKGL
jgi:hypothetical protein